MKLGDFRIAYEAAFASGNWFQENGQQFNYATSMLLQGQAQLAFGEVPSAIDAGSKALLIVAMILIATHESPQRASS